MQCFSTQAATIGTGRTRRTVCRPGASFWTPATRPRCIQHHRKPASQPNRGRLLQNHGTLGPRPAIAGRGADDVIPGPARKLRPIPAEPRQGVKAHGTVGTISPRDLPHTGALFACRFKPGGQDSSTAATSSWRHDSVQPGRPELPGRDGPPNIAAVRP